MACFKDGILANSRGLGLKRSGVGFRSCSLLFRPNQTTFYDFATLWSQPRIRGIEGIPATHQLQSSLTVQLLSCNTSGEPLRGCCGGSLSRIETKAPAPRAHPLYSSDTEAVALHGGECLCHLTKSQDLVHLINA